MKNLYLFLAFINMSSVYTQVGIGTLTPSATLDIITPGNTSATKALEINNSDATEMITVLNNGNVGIGATVPTSRLEVLGNNSLNAIGIGNSSLSSTFRTKISTEGSGTQDRWMKFNSDWGTLTNGTRAFGFFRGTAEYLTILDNGNIGIGLNTPRNSLEIARNSTYLLNLTRNILKGDGFSTGIAFYYGGNTSELNNPIARIVAKDTSPTHAGGDLILGAALNSTMNDIITIKGDTNNVGIGTVSAPQAKLEVNGIIKIGDDATTPVAGMIRFNGTNFQGYNGTTWVNLD